MPTVTGTGTGYTVRVNTSDGRGQYYQNAKAGGATTRSCDGAKSGGCKSGGTW
jgi:hypothetical protein